MVIGRNDVTKPLRTALRRVAVDPARRSVLDALRILAITPADPERFSRLLDLEREAAELGYPELC